MKKNSVQLSILIYLVFIVIFIYTKPQFIYKDDGSLKKFGTGESNTIFPLWLLVLLTAFFSYYLAQIIILKSK